MEAEEEVADVFPSSCTTSGSSFTLSSSGHQFHQLTNNITVPKTTNPVYSGRNITAATLSDLDGIDMMNLPVDLDESPSDPMDISLDEIKLVPVITCMNSTVNRTGLSCGCVPEINHVEI